MKLHFLGTGAADWDITNTSTDINYRRFSSILVDDILLIDPGPCVYEFAESFGYEKLTQDIRYIVNTHRHGDHYDETTVENLCKNGAEYYDLERDKPIAIGDYIIRAYEANHGTCINANHIAVEDKSGKKLFYACDGCWFPYETYLSICEYKPDMLIFDCTIGDTEGDYRIFDHNNIRMVLEMAMTLRQYCGGFMVSHMARTLHGSHEELCERLAPHKIIPAHDDMIIKI